MIYNILSFFFVLIFLSKLSYGQDVQFSQFYASPLYLNPGFVGASNDIRTSLHYRIQWVGTNANYQTALYSFDMPLLKNNIAIGGYLLQDDITQKNGSLQSRTSFIVNGGYHLKINRDWMLSFGLQFGFEQTSLGFDRLIFDDQINSNGIIEGPTQEKLLNEKIINPDISSGLLFYGNKMWLGISIFHMTQPSTSRIQDSENKLFYRLSGQFGYKIPLTYKWHNIVPNFDDKYLNIIIHYQKQGTKDQLSTGLSLNYSPIIVGVWYRGILFQENGKHKLYNHDAIVIMTGVKFKMLTFSYSFDLPIGGLSLSEGTSHEFMLKYNFNHISKYKKKKKKVIYPTNKCPFPKF